jgi:hypothetical protein
MAPRVGTTALRSVRRQMATNTRVQTGRSIRTQGVAGKATKAEAGTVSRNPAAQATTPLLPGAGENRKGAAAHRPSAAAVGAGEQGRTAPVVGEAPVEVAAGEVEAAAGAVVFAGESDGAALNRVINSDSWQRGIVGRHHGKKVVWNGVGRA